MYCVVNKLYIFIAFFSALCVGVFLYVSNTTLNAQSVPTEQQVVTTIQQFIDNSKHDWAYTYLEGASVGYSVHSAKTKTTIYLHIADNQLVAFLVRAPLNEPILWNSFFDFIGVSSTAGIDIANETGDIDALMQRDNSARTDAFALIGELYDFNEQEVKRIDASLDNLIKQYTHQGRHRAFKHELFGTQNIGFFVGPGFGRYGDEVQISSYVEDASVEYALQNIQRSFPSWSYAQNTNQTDNRTYHSFSASPEREQSNVRLFLRGALPQDNVPFNFIESSLQFTVRDADLYANDIRAGLRANSSVFGFSQYDQELIWSHIEYIVNEHTRENVANIGVSLNINNKYIDIILLSKYEIFVKTFLTPQPQEFYSWFLFLKPNNIPNAQRSMYAQ